jgi:putative ABC transport system ATP-binding protein
MLIRTSQLRKTYVMGSVEVHALQGVDFTVERGEFVAIMGSSGSGKSTMLHLLGCLDQPTSGRYELGGTPVETLDDKELSRLRNERIGIVFQSFNLILQHDAVENVELPLIYKGVPKDERRERAIALLQRVGLGDKIRHRPQELSGGEMQRVAVARALAADPLLVLADEPTGNLDSRNSTEIMELFRELHAAGTTILMVTHDEETAVYAQRVIEMKDGLIFRDTADHRGDGHGFAAVAGGGS